MRMARIECQAEHAFQFVDAGPRFGSERRLAFERVQDDALEQIAERHVVIVGQRLQHLQQALLQPDAGLDALDNDGFDGFAGHGT